MIGTNDLSLGVDLQQIVANVRTILEEIDRRAPGTTVVIQSVMPRSAGYRDDILFLNDAYGALANALPDHVEFLDLWPVLADEDGVIPADFSADALHLTGLGYEAWQEILRPRLERMLGARMEGVEPADSNQAPTPDAEGIGVGSRRRTLYATTIPLWGRALTWG